MCIDSRMCDGGCPECVEAQQDDAIEEETCIWCEKAEGVPNIVGTDDYLCPDCVDAKVRQCCDCGWVTNDSDTSAEVSFCIECRSVESLYEIEVK